MTAPPALVAQARVDEELPLARAWAKRKGLELDWNEDELKLRVPLQGPGAKDGEVEPYLLIGAFREYKALPPRWRFVHPETEEDIGPPAFPAAPQGEDAPRPAPLFTGGGPTGAVICAPFNRLAYAEEGGPHQVQDWGAPGNWEKAGASNQVRAVTIAEMLAAIHLDVCHSRGRMAALA